MSDAGGIKTVAGLAAVKVELCELSPLREQEQAEGWERRPRFKEQSWLCAQSEDRVDDLAERIQSRLPKGFVARRSALAWTERGIRAMTRLGAPAAVFRVSWEGPDQPDEGWGEGDLDLEAALSRAIREGFKEGEGDRPSYRALGDRLADRQMRANAMVDREVAFWPEIVARREAWLLARAMEGGRGEKRRSL